MEEYSDLLENNWRKEKLLAVCKMLLEYASALEEDIRYKMPNFGKEGCYILALNAHKRYLSLYVGTIKKIEQSEKLLVGFNQGKGSIRIKKTNRLQESNLETFIHKTVYM